MGRSEAEVFVGIDIEASAMAVELAAEISRELTDSG